MSTSSSKSARLFPGHSYSRQSTTSAGAPVAKKVMMFDYSPAQTVANRRFNRPAGSIYPSTHRPPERNRTRQVAYLRFPSVTGSPQPFLTQPNTTIHSPTVAQRPKRKSPLSNISSTYQVPDRSQAPWLESFLSSVPMFFWLFLLGIVISMTCAIALSFAGSAPITLLTTLSDSISFVIPYLFVLGVVSFGVTVVWDAFR